MDVAARLAELEQRLKALEQENRELKAAEPRPVPPVQEWRRKTAEEQQKLVESLSPAQRVAMKELARDVMKYGWDQAMEMHGRRLPKRGQKAA